MGTGKKMLQAITNLMGRWKVEEEQTWKQSLFSQQAAQLQNQAAAANWTTTTTSTSAASGTNISTGFLPAGGLLSMGGAGVSSGMMIGPGTYTYTVPTAQWELTAPQFDRLLAFMERAMHYSWTCVKCQRQYAPITPDCEFCNFVERLEGQGQDAA